MKGLDQAFQGFFRRLKAHQGKAGFPDSAAKGRWEAFGFAEFSGIRIDGKRVHFAGISGGLKQHLHRPLPENPDIRSCVLRREGRGWVICLHIALETPEKHAVSSVEDLNVSHLIRHRTLARSIADASWSRFISMLDYKVAKAGGHPIRVDPRNTSQKCSGCAELVPKSLAVRTHACPSCGLAIDRDHNASLNICAPGLARGA